MMKLRHPLGTPFAVATSLAGIALALTSCSSFTVPTEVAQAAEVAEMVSGLQIPDSWTPVTDGESLAGKAGCITVGTLDCAEASFRYQPVSMPTSIDELTAILPQLEWSAPVQDCQALPADLQIGTEPTLATTCSAEAELGLVKVEVSMIGTVQLDGTITDPMIDLYLYPLVEQ